MADRYWVGGTGTWDSSDTTHWSTTSGGSGGASVPTSSDYVYIDQNSGVTGYKTITLSGTLYCYRLFINGGPINTPTELTVNFSSAVLNVTDWCYFSSNYIVNLGSSTVNCVRFTAGDYGTITKGTSTINCDYLDGGGYSFYSVNVGIQINYSWTGSNPYNNSLGTFNYFTTTGLELSVNGNFTVSNGLTIQGTSDSRRYVYSTASEVARTITISPGGSVTLAYVDFEDITASGTTWTGTSLGNCLGNSNITFTPAVTRYAVSAGSWSSTARWSTTSGGSSGASSPIPQDTAIFDSNSGVGTYTVDFKRLPSINTTGFTGTLFFNGTCNVYDSLIVPFPTTVSISGQLSINLAARSSKNVTFDTSANILLTVNRPSANYTATGTIGKGDDTCKLQLRVNKGTFNASTNSLQLVNYSSLSGSTTNMGSGTWTLRGSTATTIWNAAGTLNKETSNIVISTGTNVSFYGGSKSYNKITIAGRSETYSVSFYGNNTISELEYTTGTGTHTINFESGSTTNIEKWSVQGVFTRKVNIGSTSASSHTLNYTGTGYAFKTYLSISYSTATPAYVWYAGVASTDAGNNTGWIFSEPQQGNLFFGSNF